MTTHIQVYKCVAQSKYLFSLTLGILVESAFLVPLLFSYRTNQLYYYLHIKFFGSAFKLLFLLLCVKHDIFINYLIIRTLICSQNMLFKWIKIFLSLDMSCYYKKNLKIKVKNMIGWRTVPHPSSSATHTPSPILVHICQDIFL